ncbi:DUF5590 domain-containing protein [Candidatus Enterococcus leclercqii]|uniref:cell wall elongation regulator TseB-like domain-containing protein n=1 Tax=Candidatus Enterococcus leclercqii TaxID=1857218 RepID=UPI00137AB7D6|nr:DUF5590 domain-containing protein [Enterococcus sp. CU9D]KAF1291981.1 peptidase [Enterococcus sp. CU9D]
METSSKKGHRLEWILLVVTLVLVFVIIGFVSLFYRSSRPLAQAKDEATTMAKKYADLDTVDEFYWFTREKTYFSLLGKDKNGSKIAVIMPKDGDKIKVLNQKDGITELQALQKAAQAYPDEQVMKASLGMFDEKPVWEVTSESGDGAVNFLLLSYEEGKEIKKISNI